MTQPAPLQYPVRPKLNLQAPLKLATPSYLKRLRVTARAVNLLAALININPAVTNLHHARYPCAGQDIDPTKPILSHSHTLRIDRNSQPKSVMTPINRCVNRYITVWEVFMIVDLAIHKVLPGLKTIEPTMS
jgi:hypothetical protein